MDFLPKMQYDTYHKWMLFLLECVSKKSNRIAQRYARVKRLMNFLFQHNLIRQSSEHTHTHIISHANIIYSRFVVASFASQSS